MKINLKTKILAVFSKNSGKLISGGDFEKQFGVTRAAVWKAVKELQNEGFLIESKDRSGYIYSGDGDVLNAGIIAKSLKTARLGRYIEILESVDSTNFYLKRMLPVAEGYTVIADKQTNGQGRRSRVFHSPSGGVYLSVLLKPVLTPQDIQFLTICAAVAVSRALKETCGFNADVKWINDIFYNGKKLCGISTEASLNAEVLGVDHVIMGIGINTAAIPDEVKHTAISVEAITNQRGFRNALIAAVLNYLEEYCDNFFRYGKTEILEEYKKRLFILNKTVTVYEGQNCFKAVALDLNESGALIISGSDGKPRTLNAGEISLEI